MYFSSFMLFIFFNKVISLDWNAMQMVVGGIPSLVGEGAVRVCFTCNTPKIIESWISNVVHFNAHLKKKNEKKDTEQEANYSRYKRRPQYKFKQPINIYEGAKRPARQVNPCSIRPFSKKNKTVTDFDEDSPDKYLGYV